MNTNPYLRYLWAFAAVLLFGQANVQGQEIGETWTMDFDDPDATFVLDSIYPPGCWQIGTPDKPAFTSAWSPPNALVTDTLAPHPVSTRCHAQFSSSALVLSQTGLLLQFKHTMDTDSMTAFGWIEFSHSETDEWLPFGHEEMYSNLWREAFPSEYPQSTWDYLWTDTGYFYTGNSPGWRYADFRVDCALLAPDPWERGGQEATMQFRLVFEATTNELERDGWMIDDLSLTGYQCMGSISEHAGNVVSVHPNPAWDRLWVECDVTSGTDVRLEVLALDGRLLQERRIRWSVPQAVDLQGLAHGQYLLRLVARDRTYATRFTVRQ
jgi:hypothetical protein